MSGAVNVRWNTWREKMRREIERYADELVERLICLKDLNRKTLTSGEIDTINEACNLIDHNKEYLQENA